MTSAEFIEIASKIVAISLGAYGAIAAWKIKRDEAERRRAEAEAARLKAKDDAQADQAKIDKLRRDIERDCTEGYHKEIARLQARADKQDQRIDDLMKRIQELERENELYRRWNQMMAAHIAANGLPAIPRPEQ